MGTNEEEAELDALVAEMIADRVFGTKILSNSGNKKEDIEIRRNTITERFKFSDKVLDALLGIGVNQMRDFVIEVQAIIDSL